MQQDIALYQVDAFADRLFAGNPAAVCPLEDWLPDALLQGIAAENNLSETAFLRRRGDDYEIRWFTTVTEVDLCGHATLGSAYVVSNYLEPGREQVRFHSRSGPLDVVRQGRRYAMDFPALKHVPCEALEAVAQGLGARPAELWEDMDMMAVFTSEAEILALEPDMAKIARLPTRGVIVTAPGQDCDFVSRFFAPGAGIPQEDPVTGSAHSMLTPYWAKRLLRTRMQARQLSPRGGALEVEHRGERVLIAGRVVPYLEGRIRVPQAEVVYGSAAL